MDSRQAKNYPKIMLPIMHLPRKMRCLRMVLCQKIMISSSNSRKSRKNLCKSSLAISLTLMICSILNQIPGRKVILSLLSKLMYSHLIQSSRKSNPNKMISTHFRLVKTTIYLDQRNSKYLKPLRQLSPRSKFSIYV